MGAECRYDHWCYRGHDHLWAGIAGKGWYMDLGIDWWSGRHHIIGWRIQCEDSAGAFRNEGTRLMVDRIRGESSHAVVRHPAHRGLRVGHKRARQSLVRLPGYQDR